MRVHLRTLLLTVVKLVLSIGAVYYLFFILLFVLLLPFSSPPTDEPPEGPVIAWLLLPLCYVIAAGVVSLLVGMLFTRDRWVASVAAVTPVLCGLLWGTFSSPHPFAPDQWLWFRVIVLPMGVAAVVAFVSSPFLHDLGRVLRGYLRGRSRPCARST